MVPSVFGETESVVQRWRYGLLNPKTLFSMVPNVFGETESVVQRWRYSSLNPKTLFSMVPNVFGETESVVQRWRYSSRREKNMSHTQKKSMRLDSHAIAHWSKKLGCVDDIPRSKKRGCVDYVPWSKKRGCVDHARWSKKRGCVDHIRRSNRLGCVEYIRWSKKSTQKHIIKRSKTLPDCVWIAFLFFFLCLLLFCVFGWAVTVRVGRVDCKLYECNHWSGRHLFKLLCNAGQSVPPLTRTVFLKYLYLCVTFCPV